MSHLSVGSQLGVGGELTASEEATVQEIDGISHAVGTILVSTGSVWSSLPAGTDGYLLTLDSGEATGVKWAVDPGAGDLKADGTVPLTANWDVGAYTITGTQFISDIAIGTAPFVVTSTTEVTNLKSATVGTITGLAPDTATTQATQASITSAANLVTVGALNSGSIASGFGNIDVGGSSISAGSFDASDGNITNVGSIDLDTIRADAANGSITIELDNAAGADLIVGNNNALVVEGDNDKVGFGTATPGEVIHTYTAGNNVGRFESTDAIAYIQVNDSVDSFYLGTDNQIGFLNGTAATGTGLNIDLTNGEVGIGTSSPGSLLDVRGAAGAAGILTLATDELTVVDGNKLGQIDFQAPIESAGTDAILVAASIWAEADATFSSSVNNTDLVFAVATSETAVEHMRLSKAEGLNLITGLGYYINATSVLNATTLGSGVTASSLTSLGTIATGVWEATDVGVAHGGTGKSSWTQYLIPYADTTTSFSQIAIGTSTQVLTSNGAGAAPTFQDAAAAGATTALDNLASVAINLPLISDTYNTDALGSSAIGWSDLYLGTGAVIEWSSAASTADVTLTHSANTLTLAGGAFTSDDVITGLTLEATGDTAAGDNAAIGYAAADGLVLTGQGSTGDITFRNDADALVAHIPTGTTEFQFAGLVGIATAPDVQKLTVGGAIKVTAAQPGSDATSHGLIDYNAAAGTTRLYSRGVDATTRGLFQFNIAEQDLGNNLTPMTIEDDGGITFQNLLQQSSSGLVVEYDTTTKELYAETSSKKFKTGITPLKIDTSKIYDLRPVTFKTKKKVRTKTGEFTSKATTIKVEEFGLIAEEVHLVMPEMVIYDENGDPYSVKYQKLAVVLLKELQSLNKRVEVLEKKPV